MPSRSVLAGHVLSYAANPDMSVLPLDTVFTVLYDVEQSLSNDLDISEQGQLLRKVERSLSSKSFYANVDGSVVYAQLRPTSDSTSLYEVEIVDVQDLEQMRREARRALALYDSPTRIDLSWDPAGTEQRIILWYERNAEDASSITSSPSVNRNYHTLLKMRAAALCREIIGLPALSSLTAEILRGEKQWARHVTKSRSSGGKKRPYGIRRGIGTVDAITDAILNRISP